MTANTYFLLLLTVCMLGTTPLHADGDRSKSLGPTPSQQALPGLGSWSGVRTLRLKNGQTVRPDVPLRLETSPRGRVRAAIADDPSGTVSLQQWKGHIRGVVRSPVYGTWLIKITPTGITSMIELDPSTLVGCETVDAPNVGVDNDGEGSGDPPMPPMPPMDGDVLDGDDGGVVDVFVAYTDLARANAGSTDAMETAIHGWINESNDVYSDSESAMRIRLVGTDEVVYSESGSFSEHLSRLSGTSDGYMDDVHTWRDDTGADVVMLIVTDSDSCGRGYTIKNDVTGSPTGAFAVVRDYCADVQYSFTHELGHILGCCHDEQHPGSCSNGNSLYPYSFGYRFAGDVGNWRTVMAYTDDNDDPWVPIVSYTRIGLLSNPAVTYDNAAAGSSTADNAATHDSMRTVTAAYRTANAPITCPGDLGSDAEVSIDDLLELLALWGGVDPSDSVSLAADLNGDATIDSSDLVVLLAEYGPCPG
ncbi:MAG: hypothetical protein GY894_07575 [Planctomycetes bacterium]|nr:hypothetical protein [Planctomycetota bacterium]MCP4839205.1 hypothetical protein [Planctomycetota bacterium]